MSLANYPYDATPEEVTAYNHGHNESRRMLRILAQRCLEYELALNTIRRARDQAHAFEIASNALAKHQATK
jgi:hypothetical protein